MLSAAQPAIGHGQIKDGTNSYARRPETSKKHPKAPEGIPKTPQGHPKRLPKNTTRPPRVQTKSNPTLSVPWAPLSPPKDTRKGALDMASGDTPLLKIVDGVAFLGVGELATW